MEASEEEHGFGGRGVGDGGDSGGGDDGGGGGGGKRRWRGGKQQSTTGAERLVGFPPLCRLLQ